MRRSIWLCFVALLALVPALYAQDDTDAPADLPAIPYYTSQDGGRQFNVPIPAGWQIDDSNAGFIRMTTSASDDEIFVIALPADAESQAALDRILNDTTVSQRAQSVVTFDGLTWDVTVYDMADGGNVSLFAQSRESAVYAVMHVNPRTDVDVYMVAAQSATLGTPATVEDILSGLFPELDATPDDVQSLMLGATTWQRSEFSDDDDTIITLHQQRGGNVYTVIERGDGATIAAIDRALYTVIFGFFVTPDNSNFLWFGLVASFGIVLLLVLSIYARHRNAEKDLRLIEQLEADDA